MRRLGLALACLAFTGGAARAQGMYLLGAAKVDVTRSAGRIKCRSADGLARARLTPGRGGSLRVGLQLRRQTVEPPFTPPLHVTVTTGDIDRAGTITTCAATSTAMKCRQ